MNQENRNQRVLLITIAVVAGVIGYLVGYNGDRIRELESEILRLKSSQAHSTANRRKQIMVQPRQAHRVSETNRTSAASAFDSSTDFQTQAHRKNLSNWVEQTAAEMDAEYSNVFFQLGVEEHAERFKSNLVQLHRKAIAAGEPMLDLLHARIAYDRDVRKLLGEDGYRRYVDYERIKPAVREYNLLSAFSAQTKGNPLEPEYFEKIVQLIKDAGATTTETWHGPYDPIPRPASGEKMIAERLKNRIELLESSSKSLLDAVAASELPEVSKNVINEYYNHKLEEKRRELSFASLPAEERHKMISAEADRLIEEQKRRGQQQRKNR